MPYSLFSNICRIYHINEKWFYTGEGNVFSNKNKERQRMIEVAVAVCRICVENNMKVCEFEKYMGFRKNFIADLKRMKTSISNKEIFDIEKNTTSLY